MKVIQKSEFAAHLVDDRIIESIVMSVRGLAFSGRQCRTSVTEGIGPTAPEFFLAGHPEKRTGNFWQPSTAPFNKARSQFRCAMELP